MIGDPGVRLEAVLIRFESASWLPVLLGDQEQLHNPHSAVRSWKRMICIPG
jgi:hypothetical protein